MFINEEFFFTVVGVEEHEFVARHQDTASLRQAWLGQVEQ
jgi:hypothetical protein